MIRKLMPTALLGRRDASPVPAYAASRPMPEIIAEIGGNHAGLLDNALRLIKEAAFAGANTVKFQCFTPKALANRRQNNLDVIAAVPDGVPLIELYNATWTPQDWFPTMITEAKRHGLKWFSSVFSPEDVAFLEALGCPRYKISAFDIFENDTIAAARKTGKPLIISIRNTDQVTFMRATGYDGKSTPLGLSDHSKGLTEIYKGGDRPSIIERHIRLPDVSTVDDDISFTPDEFRRMIEALK